MHHQCFSWDLSRRQQSSNYTSEFNDIPVKYTIPSKTAHNLFTIPKPMPLFAPVTWQKRETCLVGWRSESKLTIATFCAIVLRRMKEEKRKSNRSEERNKKEISFASTQHRGKEEKLDLFKWNVTRHQWLTRILDQRNRLPLIFLAVFVEEFPAGPIVGQRRQEHG